MLQVLLGTHIFNIQIKRQTLLFPLSEHILPVRFHL